MRRGFSFSSIAFMALLILMFFEQDSLQKYNTPPHLVGIYRWSEKSYMFGGWSGFDITNDGEAFLAISDGGILGRGIFRRDEQGKITGIKNLHMGHLITPSKNKEKAQRDAEGIAIAGTNVYYVSFEGIHRIIRYGPPSKEPVTLPLPDEILSYPPNKGLEALAIGPSGRLYTLPEQSDIRRYIPRIKLGKKIIFGEKEFPIWRFTNGVWDQPFHLNTSGHFRPVGADFGPDERLYILERVYSPFRGFSSQIRSFDIGETQLENEHIEMRNASGFHDNLEGLGVWRDKSGSIRFTMISDDNFRKRFQSTEVVEYKMN